MKKQTTLSRDIVPVVRETAEDEEDMGTPSECATFAFDDDPDIIS